MTQLVEGTPADVLALLRRWTALERGGSMTLPRALACWDMSDDWTAVKRQMDAGHAAALVTEAPA